MSDAKTDQETDMPKKVCTLYTFAQQLYEGNKPKGCGVVKVARITSGDPDDWHVWPESYMRDYPSLRLIEIAGICLVDESQEANP